MPDRLLAADLARAIDGAETANAEAQDLARLLREAADAVWFEVSPEETESALRSLADRDPATIPRPRRRRWRPAIAIAAVAAIALLALVLVPEWGSESVDVEARARQAVTGGGVLHVSAVVDALDERLEDGGQVSWLDARRGRVRVTRTAPGAVPRLELLQVPGRYIRYQPSQGIAVVADSCAAVASGCAELQDPVTLYRRALLRAGVADAERVTVDGRAGYRFSLPLAGAGIAAEQEVTVDAATFLPVRIVWRDRSGPVARIDVTVERIPVSSVPDGTFTLRMLPGTHVRQVTAAGPVRLLDERPVQLSQLDGPVGWVGRDAGGIALQGASLLRFDGGRTAVRLDYGPVTVWSYDQAVPPPLRSGAFSPSKVLTDGEGNVIHFYELAGGGLAAERDLGPVTVAVVAPEAEKFDVIALLADAELR